MSDYTELLDEASHFFHSRAEYKKLFLAMIDKYRRLKRIGGKITLYSASLEEQDALSDFLNVDYRGKRTITIALADVERALANTKYHKLSLFDLLKAYHGDTLLTKEEEEILYQESKDTYFENFRKQFDNPICQEWLNSVLAKEHHTRSIHIAYGRDCEKLKHSVALILKALSNLPNTYERLPHFAQKVSGNSNTFDFKTDTGRLFIDALKVIYHKQNPDNAKKLEMVTEQGHSFEDDSEWLYVFKLLRDDIANFVTVSGLTASNEKSQPCQYWYDAWQAGAVLNLPLREIIKAESIMSVTAYMDKHNERNKVFVIKNTEVFSAILDAFKNENRPLPPLLCLHGQLRLASWVILERLIAGGCMIYYSGDFDPESLIMAYSLYQRYPDSVRLWHYSMEDYNQSISDTKLDFKRLNKLSLLNNTPFAEIAQAIQNSKRIGCQERLISLLIEDLIKLG